MGIQDLEKLQTVTLTTPKLTFKGNKGVSLRQMLITVSSRLQSVAAGATH